MSTTKLDLEEQFNNRYYSRFFKMNAHVLKFEKDVAGYYVIPKFVKMEDGITSVEATEEAFNLNPPAIALFDTIRVPYKINIMRVLVSYEISARSIRNATYFNHVFDKIVNDGINKMIEKIGFSHEPNAALVGGTYMTYINPNGTIFFESENYAGYELRLYSDAAITREL